jgi:hypothetical protein
MSGIDKPGRRAVLQHAAAAIGVIGAAVSGCASVEVIIVEERAFVPPQRQKKSLALYKDWPNKGDQCGRCTRYVAPGDCRAVVGPVSAHGWCQNFRAVA